MAGTKREIEPGVWELLVYAGRDPVTGKKRQRSKRFRGGSRAASEALAAFVTEVRGIKTPVPTEATVAWLIDHWLTVQEPVLAPRTLKTYRGYFQTWLRPRFSETLLSDLTSGDLRELHNTMAKAGRRPSTIHQVHNILRGALTYAVEKEWLDRNVAALRKAPPVGGSEVVACTDKELETLLTEAGQPGSDLWTAIALGAALGRRLGQLCTIRHSAIDLPGRKLTLVPTRKSPKATVLDLDRETVQVLSTRLDWQESRLRRICGPSDPDGLLADPFLLSRGSEGLQPHPDGYTGAFRRLRDQLGYKHLHFHCLRHWCATTLINRGVPLQVVAERLGHSSPAVTLRIYANVQADQGIEAARLLGEALPIPRQLGYI